MNILDLAHELGRLIPKKSQLRAAVSTSLHVQDAKRAKIVFAYGLIKAMEVDIGVESVVRKAMPFSSVGFS